MIDYIRVNAKIDKINDIIIALELEYIQELRTLLGVTNCYVKFILNLATIL